MNTSSISQDFYESEEHLPMRNPESVTLVRHVESYYNALTTLKHKWPEYHAFRAVFDAEFYSDIQNKVVRPDLKQLVKRGQWPSQALLAITHPYSDKIDEYMGNTSNYNTPISAYGEWQGEQTGLHIHEVAPKPDIVIYSDYLRTRRTMELVLRNAPNKWQDSIKKRYHYHPVEEMEYGGKAVWSDKHVAYVYEPMLMLGELQDPYEFRKSGGQSAKDHRDQLSRFWGHVKRRYVDKNVLVFTHHLAIIAAIAEMQHFTRSQYIDWNKTKSPANASVTIFRRETASSASGKDRLVLAGKDYNICLYDPKNYCTE